MKNTGAKKYGGLSLTRNLKIKISVLNNTFKFLNEIYFNIFSAFVRNCCDSSIEFVFV